MFKLKNTVSAVILGFAALTSSSYAETFEVTITNVTAGQVITPPVLISHTENVSLFTPGQPAPEYLIPLAEDGDASQFKGAEKLTSISAVTFSEGPVLPGQSVTLTITTDLAHPVISIAGMLASSNDAFMAINGAALDFKAHSISTLTARVYDAGSEYNSENCDFIPGPPCGNHQHDETGQAEGYIYVSNGIKGIADLDSATFDWNNPAAIISIKRTGN